MGKISMVSASFVLLVLPLLVIATSIVIFFVKRKKKD